MALAEPERAAVGGGVSAGGPGDPPAVEPMTAGQLARLFIVPGVIVAGIIGAAVVVVVLFGAISKEPERSIDELVSVLESSRGEHGPGGMLLPRQKEVWQAGAELVLRLSKKERELDQAQVADVGARLARLVAAETGQTAKLNEDGRKRLHLLMRALAETRDPAAIALLAELLADGNADTRREALIGLGCLTGVEGAKAALPAVRAAASDPEPVVRIVACVLLGRLASAGDVDTIEALRRAYVDDNREVRWNAALALARLGSNAGADQLEEMLRRDYWQRDVRVSTRPPNGEHREYEMPPEAVERYLTATMEAAANLDEAKLWEEIGRLESDPAPQVAAKAREMAAGRGRERMPGGSR